MAGAVAIIVIWIALVRRRPAGSTYRWLWS